MLELITSFAPEGASGAALWLPLVWATLLAIAVAMYVVADGFDLGVGILFNAAGSENWRDRMMLSVAPIWDGNETWLILGGGGLLAVFYLAYAILLPALYIPLFVMLIALIFRGVAFEFRFKADTSKRIWDYAFHYGSLVATFAQGVVLGAFVQGFHVEGRQFAGGTFDWLSPFSLTTGVVPGARHRAALVHLAQYRVPRAGAPPHGVHRLPALPRPRGRPARGAVPARDRAVPARVPGARREPLPLHRPTALHDLAGLEHAGLAGLRARRLRGRDAADLHLHGLRLLRVPRQGRGGRAVERVPLMAPGRAARWRRLAWFVTLYVGSALAFMAVVSVLRAILVPR
jgi:hypothetical protein